MATHSFHAPRDAAGDVTALYTGTGERKYLTRDERHRLLEVLGALPVEQALFIETLLWSGARISEVLALTPLHCAVGDGKIALRTLKRRRFCMREVALPARLLVALDMCFRLEERRTEPPSRLWPWHRVTGWRIVKRAVARAGLSGLAATPRGLRHSFGVAGVEASVPVTIIQKWLGHASLQTTSIYTSVMGREERALAMRLFSCGIEGAVGRESVATDREPTTSPDLREVV